MGNLNERLNRLEREARVRRARSLKISYWSLGTDGLYRPQAPNWQPHPEHEPATALTREEFEGVPGIRVLYVADWKA